MTDAIAQSANARNNAQWQDLRLTRWAAVRDAVWSRIDPLLHASSRVAIVGAGSCDDIPLVRIAERVEHIDLVDFDSSSTQRAVGRLDDAARARIRVLEEDVTGGCADTVLRAARGDSAMPNSLPLPITAIGTGDYDLVVGDMLYSQLLHPGLIALELTSGEQRAVMRRYDSPLTTALVRRLQASVHGLGHTLHIHDVACWSATHPQPVELAEVIEDPNSTWPQLARHDNCDPHLALERIGAPVLATDWWEWPFEPKKRFVVRATLAGAGSRTA